MVVSRWQTRAWGARHALQDCANDQRPSTNDYPKYFPTINFNFSFVAAGTLSRSVKMACASADPHLHERALGRPATVAFTTLAAFSAFLTRTEMIWSTVTESWCGCQQS